MQDYKKLNVWHKSHTLTLNVYCQTKLFPKEELFSLTNQIRRSSVSIAANIAEGCGKSSQRDCKRFFEIALGSANETEYYIILSKDLAYLKEEMYNELFSQINEVKAMLIGLIKKQLLSIES